MTDPRLRLVEKQPSAGERVVVGMTERERLRLTLAELDAQIAADVREYSYSLGYRVPLRDVEARRMILEGRKR